MKKITFLLTFLTVVSLGYAQTNLQDFEGASPSLAGFEGLGSATVVANPNAAGVNTSANVAELVVTAAGQPWQGAETLLTTNYIDVSNPVTNTISIDVYSTSAFTLYLQVENGQGGAVNAGADQPYTDVGNWQTLTFTMNEAINGSGVANGEYGKVVFFPNWAGGGWNNPPVANTVYLDNLTGTQGSSAVADPEPASAAPVPTTADANVYSIYNDTNGYTNTFNVQYGFGGGVEVDLDPDGGVVNNAYKVDLNSAGFGQGEGGPDDVSDFDFVNFNYWFESTGGASGFRFTMISNTGGAGAQEFNYEFGDASASEQADIVENSWVTVSIPMSYFTGLGFDSSNLFQWKVDRLGLDANNTGFLYVDNIVLTKDFPLSRDEFATFDSKVYNNPTSTQWTISTPNTTIKSVEVFNVLGKRVLSQDVNDVTTNIPAQSLASGIYIARINSASGVKTIKLIRE